MVQATTKNGTVSLESTIEITEGEKERIQDNPKKVNAFMSDMKVEHSLGATEDGSTLSKMSCQVKGNFNPEKEIEKLKKTHKDFLKWVDGWDSGSERQESSPEEDDGESLLGFFIIPVFV